MTRFLVLDLDGTLVDTVPDLAAAVNRLMASRSLPAHSEAAVARMVGDGIKVLIDRAFAAHGRTPDATALSDYAADYAANATDRSRLFPTVEPTLRRLLADGWRMAVCTNKPQGPAHTLLTALGIDDCFAAIGGADTFPVRKPDPAHLRATLHAAGGEPGQALMVGDHRNDIAAATGCAMPCIFAAWGYGPREMSAGAAAIAESFAEVPALAERLRP